MTIHAHALLFDNDGTLVSSLASVDRCWTRWAREYGLTAEEFGRVELHGRTAVEIAADLLPAEVVPEAVARIELLEVEDVPHGGVQPLPGTADFLASLPSPTLGFARAGGPHPLGRRHLRHPAPGRGPPRRRRHPAQDAGRRR